MTQTTSSGWNAVVSSSYRPLNTGVQIGWNKTTASGVLFFTINQSLIGGVDILKGSGDAVTFYDKYEYVDYTSYVKNWSVDRQIGQYPFGLVLAQADLELDNSSNIFLPNYDPTIGSGILPGRPMKIAVGFNTDSLQKFVGFTGQPEISIADRNIKLHAFDAMDYLNNYQFTTNSGTTISGIISGYTSTSGIAYYLNALGFSHDQYALDPSLNQTVGFIDVTDRKFGDILRDLAEAEQGLIFADENGIINFWNRQHFSTVSGYGAKFNITYSNAISIQYSNSPIINDVIVEAKPRAITVQKIVYKMTTPQELRGGNTDIFVNFSNDDGALPVVEVTTPTYSATQLNTSYYSTNAASDGSGATLDTYISISSTYLFGTTYKITFTNSYSASIYLTDLSVYGFPAEITNKITQRYSDADSITKYGRNPANNGDALIINNDYIQNSSDATSLAFTIVSAYKDPYGHYEAEIFANPALQIGDYGTITLENGTPQNVFITGMTDKLSPEGNLTQLLTLEQRRIPNYFTINSSFIAGTDELAP